MCQRISERHQVNGYSFKKCLNICDLLASSGLIKHRFYRCASNQLANVAGDTFRFMLARRDRCCYALREFNNDNININNNDIYNKHAHAGQLNRSTYLRALLLVLHNRGNLVFWAQCPSQLADGRICPSLDYCYALREFFFILTSWVR